MFYISLDIGPLLAVGQGLDAVSKEEMKKAGTRLIVATKDYITDQATKKLHTRLQMYLDKLTLAQVDDNTFMVNLDASVRWIEDGMPAHNMIDDLLKSPKAKTTKDGEKYVIVPFKKQGGNTQLTPAQQTLRDTVKAELKKQQIPYQKIETDSAGKPKIGLLHKLDITNKPIKTTNAPGQGKGPVGKVMQGPTGIPLLQGIRIYQRNQKNPDGSTSVRRDIMTFRVASTKHKGQGRWDHPGTQAVKIMDEAYDWAKRTWEKDIVPGLTLAISKNF